MRCKFLLFVEEMVKQSFQLGCVSLGKVDDESHNIAKYLKNKHYSGKVEGETEKLCISSLPLQTTDTTR